MKKTKLTLLHNWSNEVMECSCCRSTIRYREKHYIPRNADFVYCCKGCAFTGEGLRSAYRTIWILAVALVLILGFLAYDKLI